MFFKLKDAIKRTWFNFQCKDILYAPPIETKKDGLKIVSMVSHKDRLMYLIAIKTLYFYLKKGEIIVLNDGTLKNSDIKLLKHHIPDLEIISIKDIKIGKCPSGNCWERICFISDKVNDDYIIQLDSDTITINEIAEVIKNLDENRSFILGTWQRQKIYAMSDYCEAVMKSKSDHVQFIAEKNFCKLKNYKNYKYVRGSGGFSGFTKGSFFRANVELFSTEMEEIIGAQKWQEWGSEQIASNFIIANSTNASVLPFEKYPYYSAENKHKIDYNKATFMHFIGEDRFKDNFYIKLAKWMIKKLQQ